VDTVIQFDTHSIRYWTDPQPDIFSQVDFTSPFVAPPRLPVGEMKGKPALLLYYFWIHDRQEGRVEHYIVLGSDDKEIEAPCRDIFKLANSYRCYG
jgi:hypothetical protein